LLTILFALPAHGQTTVNLTVTDTPDAQTWNSGTWKTQLIPQGQPAGGSVITSGGGTLNNQAGSLSGTGTASIALPANVNISPANSQWKITVCPQAAPSPCFDSLVTVLTSSPQAVSIAPPSPRVPASVITIAYSSTEVSAAVGGEYYDLGLQTLRICLGAFGTSCSLWGSAGGGGGFSAGHSLSGTGTAQNVIGLDFGASQFLLNTSTPPTTGQCLYLNTTITGTPCTFITSTVNSIGLTTTPSNPSTGNEKFEITGITNPSGGGTGVSNPTAHSVIIAEGPSNANLVGSGTGPITCSLVYILTTSSLVDPTCALIGVAPNKQTGASYTFQGTNVSPTDNNNIVILTNTGTVAVTLAAPGSTGFAAGYTTGLYVGSTGSATITSSTNSICTTTCTTSVNVNSNQLALIYTDGTFWYVPSLGSGSGLSGLTATFFPVALSPTSIVNSLCSVVSSAFLCTYPNGIQAPAFQRTGTLPQAGPSLANNTSVGTSNAHLAKFDSNGSGSFAIGATTGDTDTFVWPVVSNAGTSGDSNNAWSGLANCTFGTPTTVNDWVVASVNVAGDCSDIGTPTLSMISGPICVLGQVQSTNAGAGIYPISVEPFCVGPDSFQAWNDYIGRTTAITTSVLVNSLVFSSATMSTNVFHIGAAFNCRNAASASATLTIGWTDSSGTSQSNISTITCTSLGAASFASINLNVAISATSPNIQFAVSISGSPTYDLHIKADGSW